jgi:predicted helicase
MTALQDLLATFRNTAKTEREKGNYFELLVKVYLQNEPLYRDMFGCKVYLWEEWRKHWMSLGNAEPQSDAGIDLIKIEIENSLG